MSTKYKFTDKEAVYFVTGTVVNWVDVFTRNIYRNILVDSFRFCQKNQGLQIHSWIIMPNHFHMICSFINDKDPGLVIKNIKSFTAIKIIDAIINNVQESRKDWMLDIFEKNGQINKSNYRFQFWQHENHLILLDNPFIYNQRKDYLHENPVRAGFVYEPQEWFYGSGIDYYTTNEKGLLDIIFLD
ncbi:MAG: transposase [Ferruginibacter sp.]